MHTRAQSCVSINERSVPRSAIVRSNLFSRSRTQEQCRWRTRSCSLRAPDTHTQEFGLAPKLFAREKLCAATVYLIDVDFTAEHVKLCVQNAEHVDHLYWRRGRADGRETDDVRKEHGHVVVMLRLDRLAEPQLSCDRRREDQIQQIDVAFSFLRDRLVRLLDRLSQLLKCVRA